MGKLRSCFYAILFVFAALSIANGDVEFRFSTIYGDHMVLQKAPKRAIVWGYGEVGQNVKLRLSDKVYNAHVYARNEGGEEVGVWQVALQPMNDSGPHFINASSYVKERLKIITLDDVLFGDVWICSGQSNMQFTLDMSDDGKEAIKDSTHYPSIRLFSAGLDCSVFQRRELCKIGLPWSVSSPETVSGNAWGYFSAVCWYYGVQLYKTLNYPIGLIASSFEGSPIESWSSHDALNQCGWIGEFLNTLPNSGIKELSTFPLYSCMWNSMIVPFLNMTIYGAIFYQGETNAMNPKLLKLPYNCTFPAMIKDWRAKWYTSTQNNTDPQFPFGFVQLSAVNYSKSSLHFAQLRWDQTAQKGYAPNAQLQNTFMAVTMDLGNPSSPYTSIHPTDKSDVGYRLALSGLSLVYGKERYFTGPLVSKIEKIAVESNMFLIINYTFVDKNIEIRNKTGFEVLCNGTWIQSPIAYNCSKSVFISVRCDPDKVRYAWSDNPCEKLKCAVYSGGLPSPPFIMDGPFPSEKKTYNGCYTA